MFTEKENLYINTNLTDIDRNSYLFKGYTSLGKANITVIIQNPENERVNIPIYMVEFKNNEQANLFRENNIIIEENVKVKIVGDSILFWPVKSEYEIDIDIEDEDLANHLVKVFRQQYVENYKKLKKENKIMTELNF